MISDGSRCWRRLIGWPTQSSGTVCFEGTLFRLSEMGRAITDARPGNATDLFRYAADGSAVRAVGLQPVPKGGLGSKFQRAYVSEIVGLDARIGRKVGSRIDPLQIERDAAVVYEHSDPQQRWTLDREEAVQEKGKPQTCRQ